MNVFEYFILMGSGHWLRVFMQCPIIDCYFAGHFVKQNFENSGIYL